MIRASAEVLGVAIADEVREAKYFAICLDTTPDCNREDQLSFVVRFVNKKGAVIEYLLDMVHVGQSDAESLFGSLQFLLGHHGLALENIRGQGFDDCATMSGKYHEIQAHVKAASPKA